MKTNHPWIARMLIVAVALALCGVPEVIAQNSAPQNNQDQQQNSPQGQQPNSPVQGTTVDPSRAPLTPAPSASQPLPNAPSAAPEANPPSPPPQANAPQQQRTGEQPVGVGAAQTGATSGGPASRPAGTAIAPAKQKQTRSLLIKLGAIAGAGIAIGTVAALSRGTPSKPPGAR